jgi:two-component system, NtrC family, nitrogen regulation sensor histidine kinase NtrY
MVSRSFHIQALARVLILTASLTMLLFLALETKLYATSALVAAITAWQIWSLVNFVDRTNLSLARFFDSIRYGDFLQTNPTGQFGGSFAELSHAMDQVSSAFHSVRTEKEEHYRYLQTIIQHVGVGLIAFTEDGRIKLLNPAARRLLQIAHLRDLAGLRRVSAELADCLEGIEPGQRALVKLSTDYETLQLSIHATKIRLGKHPLTLVTFQNIGTELAEQEMVAWQNLIRVLTHEIMNSMTPIASLAGSVSDAVRRRIEANKTTGGATPESYDDIGEALATIERRSQGLMHFVESYRDLTRIPRPDLRVVPMSELVARVDRLMESTLTELGIKRQTQIAPENLTVVCDPDLIEQVLINLFSNAANALRSTPQPVFSLSCYISRESRVVIEVSDNGIGILPNVIDKIFIPFFTTKKGGTGIGLAISRQIMRLHQGHIGVRSTPGTATIFTLTF